MLARFLLAIFWIGISIGWPSRAQTPPSSAAPSAIWQVYLERGTLEDGRDRLIFLNALNGERESLDVYGQRYTLVDDAVWFFDYRNRVMLIAQPGRNPRPHPFIQLDAQATRVDWVLSADGDQVAWTLTRADDGGWLTTRTQIADLDGDNQREVWSDGPQAGVRALPIALSADGATLYMDQHPDGLSRFTAYTQYAGLFALDVANGTVATLPDEPACFCGAAIQGDTFARLVLSADASGYDLHLHDLATGFESRLEAVRLRQYTQAGDVTFSPDGRYLVYALSQVAGFGTVNQEVRTVFVLVDLFERTQRTLTDPVTTYVHPVAWTEDNHALLFVSPQRSGTWKVRLDEGTFERVADLSYLGTLQNQ